MTQNNKILIGVGVVVLILIIGFFAFNKKNSDTANPGSITDSNDQNSMQEIKETSEINTEDLKNISLFNLFDLNKTMQCNYQSTTDESVNGTVYVAGNKARGQIRPLNDGESTESNFISDGEYMYVWTGSEGMKMSLIEAKKFASESLENMPQSMPKNPNVDKINSDVNVQCSDWSEDPSVFELPVGVEFIDIMEQINKMTESIPNITGDGQSMDIKEAMSAACAQCETLSGDTKIQCLTSLNCN